MSKKPKRPKRKKPGESNSLTPLPPNYIPITIPVRKKREATDKTYKSEIFVTIQNTVSIEATPTIEAIIQKTTPKDVLVSRTGRNSIHNQSEDLDLLKVKIAIKSDAPNPDTSNFWTLDYLVFPIGKFLDKRQGEEWIGDFEEAIWEMKNSELSHWYINLKILCRAFPLIKSLIRFKIKNWFSYIKSRAYS